MTIYNYNLMNNGVAGLFQQGLGAISGGCGYNNAGFGNFQIGNMLGGNMFTNCYGEVDYDKMAGYNVAGALFTVGAQAYQSIKSQKEPKVDYNKQISELNNEIQTKQNSLLEKTEAKTNLETGKIKASQTITSLEGQKIVVSTLEVDVSNAKKAYEANNTPENKAALENAERALNNAKAKNEEIETEIKAQKTVIEDAEAKIKTLDGEIETLESEIKQLKSKRDNLKTQDENKTLNTKAGNFLTRASKKCLDDKYSAEENPASKSEIQRAYTEFVKCKDIEQKKVYAQKVKEMYDSNPKLKENYEDRVDAIDNWLKRN